MRFTYVARFTASLALLGLLVLSSAGCTVLVDGTLAGRTGIDAGLGADTGPLPDVGPMPDSGPISACAGLGDGLRCMMPGIDEPFVCIGGVCVLSTCGDGARDDRPGSMHESETCDDGNAIPGDGCELDCTYSCMVSEDCDDGDLCNGPENCDASTHACVGGTPAADDTVCTITGTSTTAVCVGGLCRAGVCGDSRPDAGEECDDGNVVDTDGCRSDCMFSCDTDTDCQDPDACNGNETCDAATHTCAPATAILDCDDDDACTNDTCAPATGCSNVSVLVDADGDSHAATTASCGGDDCNDANPSAYLGAPEMCGATSDLNCDGATGTMPTFYPDCDGDNYARAGATGTTACTEPAAPGTCTGGWTTVAPTSGSTDCLDTSSLVRPGTASYYSTSVSGMAPPFDYNCSGAATREIYEYATSGVIPRGVSSTCTLSGTRCSGDPWWVSSTAPTCGGSGPLSQCVYVPTRLLVLAHCERQSVTSTVRCH